jgi:hypothetical protein
MSAESAQACDFKFATLKWFTPVPGLGPLTVSSVTTEVQPYHIHGIVLV